MTTVMKRIHWKQAGLIALLIVIAAFMLFPFLWAFATSLRLPKDSFNLPPAFFPTEWRWDNYAYVFTSIPFMQFITNSLKVVCL